MISKKEDTLSNFVCTQAGNLIYLSPNRWHWSLHVATKCKGIRMPLVAKRTAWSLSTILLRRMLC